MVGHGGVAFPMGAGCISKVRAKYKYRLTMVEVDREMVDRDEGWMDVGLKALPLKQANLHVMGKRKLCMLL